MVQWRGDTGEEAGYKAQLLDSVENLNVPNFFVITPQETSQLFQDVRGPEQALNVQIKGDIRDRIEDAYEDIGMSSAVRNAAGKAKNLVGGQRNNQRVSVRISNGDKGAYDYELNIGESNLFDAIKKVAASYYEKNDDNPAIIIQKMVEPEYTGAAIMDFAPRHELLEVVEGLGTSLERGIARPHVYLLEEGRVKDSRLTKEQTKVTRNPMNGKEKQKTVTPSDLPFSDSEVEELLEDLSHERLNVKFVYKRGSFHIVDAWEPERGEKPLTQETDNISLQGIRVSDGEISGELGQEIIYTEQPVPPESYQEALIARKGGYTSTDAQKSRSAEKPAIFRFEGELAKGQRIKIGPRSVEIESERIEENGDFNPFTSQQEQETSTEGKSRETGTEQVMASKVLPLDPSRGEGVFTSPPFGEGYAVTGRDAPGETIPRTGYLDSYGKVFQFEGDKAVLDARKLGRDGLEGAMNYISADTSILIVERPEPEVLETAVASGFDVFAAPERVLNSLEIEVEKAERRFILSKLRDI